MTPAPIFAGERTAAKLMDMSKADFLRLVDKGVLPSPVRFEGFERWRVSDLERAGQAAANNDDFEP